MWISSAVTSSGVPIEVSIVNSRRAVGLQIVLDLVIACSLGLGWLAQDARKRGLTAWPYFVATPFVGSMSLLAYVRRGFVRQS